MKIIQAYLCIIVCLIVQYYKALTITVPKTGQESKFYTIDGCIYVTTSCVLGGESLVSMNYCNNSQIRKKWIEQSYVRVFLFRLHP